MGLVPYPQFNKGKIEGYVLGIFDKVFLQDPFADVNSDPNYKQVLILLDKKAKQYAVVTADANNTVVLDINDGDQAIFGGLNKKNISTGKKYCWASFDVNTAVDSNGIGLV